MSDSARQVILDRIDSAVGSLRVGAASEWAQLSRPYIRSDSLPHAEVLQLFEHRIVDYGANVFKTTAEQLRETIESILTARGAKRIVIPTGVPADWLPTTTKFTEDLDLSYEKLEQFDGVLTGATVAIAATGSIVLQHGRGEGRRALTLIPDYHLCIVRADQVVETVPAAFARLDHTKPTTFISGPSATADIEMTRIKGVHGPRFMDMVLIGQNQIG